MAVGQYGVTPKCVALANVNLVSKPAVFWWLNPDPIGADVLPHSLHPGLMTELARFAP